MRKRSRIAAGWALGLLLIGALTAAARPAGEKKPAVPAAPAGPPVDAQTKIPLVDETQWSATLAQYKDKVVVANFWATWCGPCREEFPALVKLYQNHRQQGLIVLGFSMDDTSDPEPVKKFLREQKADFPAYLANPKDLEKFIDTVDKQWMGAIPATFIYDRQGTLVKRLVGAQEFKDFEKEVKPVLRLK